MKLDTTALIVTGVIAVTGASILFASVAPRRPHLRWVRQCDLSLQLAHGSLTARRTLTVDGERRYDDDRADWYAAERIDPRLWLSISWNGGGDDGPGLSWVGLLLKYDMELPLEGRFSFRRATAGSRDVPLSVDITRADNRSVASASVKLDDILNYAMNADTLDWTYDGKTTTQKIHRAGRIAIAPLREAADGRRVAGRKLAAMTADYANACPKTQDFSPLIVI